MLHIIAFLLAVFAACFLCKRQFEQVLPIVVLLSMLALTMLAMPAKLVWVDTLAIVVILAVLLLTAYALFVRRIPLAAFCRQFAADVLTPGFACFVLLVIFFLYVSEPKVIWWKDDLEHWALQPKSLWLFGGLVDHTRLLASKFGTYTPGIQVLQWWMLHIRGEWQEPALYFILYMTYVSFLLPLCAKLRWKHFWLIPLALVGIVVFPVWGNVVSYVFIGVDTTLSLCFGYTLIQIWLSRKGDNVALFSAALGLCGLVLIKQSGMILAVMAMLMIPLTRRLGKKEWLCMASPIVVWGGWMLYCRFMGLSGFHTSGMSARLQEWISGTYVPPEGADGIVEALWFALTTPYSESMIFDTLPLVSIPKIVFLVGVSAAPWAFARIYQDKTLKRIAVFFTILMIFYLLLQFFSFFTVFYDETSVYVHEQKQRMLLPMERYLAPIQLGFGMFVLWLVIDVFPRRFAAVWKKLPLCVAVIGAVLLIFTVNWGVLREDLLPDHYFQQTRAMGMETEMLMDHDWATSLEEYPDAHVLLGIEPTAESVRNFRYVFAPTRFELPLPAVMESSDTLTEYVLQNNITHLIYFDDTSILYPPASELVPDDDLYAWTLYEVFPEDDAVTLEEFW